MSRELIDALRAVADAEQVAHAILRRDYPVGGSVRWMRGERECHGIVTAHGDCDRIKVRNTVTGAEYWIEAPCIARFDGVTV